MRNLTNQLRTRVARLEGRHPPALTDEQCFLMLLCCREPRDCSPRARQMYEDFLSRRMPPEEDAIEARLSAERRKLTEEREMLKNAEANSAELNASGELPYGLKELSDSPSLVSGTGS